MRTKTRLTLSLGLITLLVLVLAAVSLGTIWKLRSEGQDVLKANYNSIEYAQRMLSTMDLEGDTVIGFQRLSEQLANQRANITEVGEAELTEQLARHIAAFRASPNNVATTRALRQDLNGIIDLNRTAIVRKTTDAEGRAETAVAWISIVGTLCFLIAFTLFLSLPERIAEPIRKLTEGIDRIAEGHYRERVEIEGSGEFGHMAERFNAMAGELERWGDSNLARIMEEKARAEAVINSLQDASIGLDDQGRILFLNRQALELLGLEGTDALDKPATEVAERNDLLRFVLNDKTSSPFKAVVDGKENYFISNPTPIQGAKGLLGTVYTVRNITPFQERDQAKTHFLATISHELKTPLASTDIGLTLLERQSGAKLTPDQGAIVADLRKDHQRLVRIVSELLDLAQAETGNIRLRMAVVPLRVLVEEAVDAVKVNARQKDIAPVVHIADDVMVRADREKAVWVLVNLLSNAVRHSPPGGAIEVRGEQRSGHVAVEVTDEGEGIPPAEHEQVFQRFAPAASAHHGSGLGLSIAREFMEAMGGSIFFDPARKKGASFTARFPIGPERYEHPEAGRRPETR
ncbi:MAG: ATP-binding protein [Flavobacteriales bacterium]